MKLTQAVLVGILIVFLILSVLNLSAISAQTLNQQEPTPTATPEKEEPTSLESGDTRGLMIGAGVIVLIILAGVFIQRLVNKP